MTVATAVELKIALTFVPGFKERYANYLGECAFDRASGYTSQYCEHGKWQWTDYDNICRGCEDGWTLRGVGAYRAALDAAYAVVHEARLRNIVMELYTRITGVESDLAGFEAWCEAIGKPTIREAWAEIPAYHREMKELDRVRL